MYTAYRYDKQGQRMSKPLGTFRKVKGAILAVSSTKQGNGEVVDANGDVIYATMNGMESCINGKVAHIVDVLDSEVQ